MLRKRVSMDQVDLGRLRGGIMSRIGWFTYLRVIFGNTTRAPPPMDYYVSKADFLRHLSKEQYNLPLKPYQEYCTSTNEIGYSLKQVYFSIYSVKPEFITWDDIMDAVISLKENRVMNQCDELRKAYSSVPLRQPDNFTEENQISKSAQKRVVGSSGDNDIPNETDEESKNLDEVPTCKKPAAILSENKEFFLLEDSSHILQLSAHGLLVDCSFCKIATSLKTPAQALELLPQSVYPSKVKGLKMVKQPLTSLKGLVSSLIILNVANCSLKSLQGINMCQKLEFLNASYNQLESLVGLSGLERLSDLHVAFNFLKDLKELSKIKRLTYVDLSGNPFIEGLEDLYAFIQCKKIKGIKIKGTELSKQKYYAIAIKQMCPNIISVDEDNILSLSNFKNIPKFVLADTEPGNSHEIPSTVKKEYPRKPINETPSRNNGELKKRNTMNPVISRKDSFDSTTSKSRYIQKRTTSTSNAGKMLEAPRRSIPNSTSKANGTLKQEKTYSVFAQNTLMEGLTKNDIIAKIGKLSAKTSMKTPMALLANHKKA